MMVNLVNTAGPHAVNQVSAFNALQFRVPVCGGLRPRGATLR